MRTTNTKIVIFLVSLLILPTSHTIAQEGAEPSGQTCPTVFPDRMSVQLLQSYVDSLNEDKGSHKNATALVGVDALGRIALAIDYGNDGYANVAMLFTSSARFDGPWSRLLTDAKVKIKKGSVLITSKPESYALSLAVKHASQPAVPGWVSESIIESDLGEFASSTYGDSQTLLASISHHDMLSWPEHFSYDLLDPGTANCYDKDCDNGGTGSTGCTGAGSGSIEGCSVSGCTGSPGGPARFACCKNASFFFASSCRCRACEESAGDPGQ